MLPIWQEVCTCLQIALSKVSHTPPLRMLASLHRSSASSPLLPLCLAAEISLRADVPVHPAVCSRNQCSCHLVWEATGVCVEMVSVKVALSYVFPRQWVSASQVEAWAVLQQTEAQPDQPLFEGTRVRMSTGLCLRVDHNGGGLM